MMGRTHALTGTAAGVGVSLYLMPLSVPEAVAGTVLCTGAALMPDIDHPNSTISNVYGPFSRAVSWLMNKATGGHRRGTHSILGIVVLGALAQAGTMYRHTVPGAIVLCTIMVFTLAGLIRLLRIPGWLDDVAPIPAVIGVVCLTDIPLGIVPLAVMLGCAVHVIGDVITKSGCPIWWPFSDDRLKLSLFKTNGVVENRVVYPAVILIIGGEIMWKVLDLVHG